MRIFLGPIPIDRQDLIVALVYCNYIRKRNSIRTFKSGQLQINVHLQKLMPLVLIPRRPHASNIYIFIGYCITFDMGGRELNDTIKPTDLKLFYLIRAAVHHMGITVRQSQIGLIESYDEILCGHEHGGRPAKRRIEVDLAERRARKRKAEQ